MNAPLRVPTRTRTPLMTDSFHDLSAEMHLMLRPNERPHQPPIERGAPDPTARRDERYRASHALPLPRLPVFVVEAHGAHRGFDRFLSRLKFEDRVAADDFLGLGERPVGHLGLAAGEA